MLTALALRTAAVQALKGATFAGDLVFDGANALPDSEQDDPRFAIVVETGEYRDHILPVTFTLWVYQRQITDDGRCGWLAAPMTRAAEMVLDALAQQVLQKLRGDAYGWAKAFRDLCTIKDTRTLAGHESLAMSLIAIDVSPVAAPVSWQSPGQAWEAFKSEAIDAGAELAPVRAVIEAALGGAPDWSAIGLGCGIKHADIAAVLADAEAEIKGSTGPGPGGVLEPMQQAAE